MIYPTYFKCVRVWWWDHSVLWTIGKAENQNWLCINLGHLMIHLRYWR